jgi:hypothetical protein
MQEKSTTIEWAGYEWLTQERWGIYHPNNPIVWYDPSQVKIENEVLKLGIGYNPIEVNLYSEDYTNILYGAGLVSCTSPFLYGRFEIEAKLPKGQPYAWPAFWMWAFESWPPEIDVFEAYSNRRGSYFNWNIDALWGNFWRCATNVHLGNSPNNYSIGAKNHWMGFKKPTENWVHYAVEWESDRIEIFYDNRSVRKITDEETLSQLRGKTMNVIINNSIQSDYLTIPNIHNKQFFLEVRNFKYTKY